MPRRDRPCLGRGRFEPLTVRCRRHRIGGIQRTRRRDEVTNPHPSDDELPLLPLQGAAHDLAGRECLAANRRVHLSVPGTSGEIILPLEPPFTSRAWHPEVNSVRLRRAKARPTGKPSAPANDTSPDASTASSKRPAAPLTTHRSITRGEGFGTWPASSPSK